MRASWRNAHVSGWTAKPGWRLGVPACALCPDACHVWFAYNQVRSKLDTMFQSKHSLAEQKLMEVRTRKGECRDRLEHYREELVRVMNCIKAENTSINALASIENEVLAIQNENSRVKAGIQSSLQELKTGQALLSKDLNQKVKAVELALARGCNILDAVMTRKHERETDLDLKCRDMFLQQHEASVKMYRYLFQVTASATV